MSERPSPVPADRGEAPRSIDEQLRHMESIPVLDGKVDYTEVRPEQPRSEVPIMMAPGWGGDVAHSFKEGMRTFAERGRTSIAIEHPQTVKQVPERMPKDLAESNPIEEVRKAAAMLEFIDAKGFEKVDVLAHSEGAIYTLLAATVAPEKFRSIVISNPAGMVGKDNLLKFVLRSMRGVGEPGTAFPGEKYKTPKELEKGGGVLGYVLSRPREALGDFVAITKSDVFRLLKGLHEKDVRIAVMAAVEDKMFQMRDLQKAFGKGGEIDGFLSVRGGHTEILDHPHEYAAAAESLFGSLEKKSKS